MNKLQNIV